jgi:lipoyl(octanoyl) transferase
VVETLGGFGIGAHLVEGTIGVFVTRPGRPAAKIAAAGVSISRGVTGHGVALNVSTDMAGFGLIVPCGLGDVEVTSMHEIVDPAPSLERVASRLVASLRARLSDGMRILP